MSHHSHAELKDAQKALAYAKAHPTSAFFLQFEEEALHRYLGKGVHDKPFENVPQILKLSIPYDFAIIEEAEENTDIHGKHMYFPGGEHIGDGEVNVLFWLDKPYSSISFDLNVIDSHLTSKISVYRDIDGAPIDYLSSTPSRGVHRVHIDHDTLQANTGTFQGFSIRYKSRLQLDNLIGLALSPA